MVIFWEIATHSVDRMLSLYFEKFRSFKNKENIHKNEDGRDCAVSKSKCCVGSGTQYVLRYLLKQSPLFVINLILSGPVSILYVAELLVTMKINISKDQKVVQSEPIFHTQNQIGKQ